MGIALQDTTDEGGDKNSGWIYIGGYLIDRLRITEAGTFRITYREHQNIEMGKSDSYIVELKLLQPPLLCNWRLSSMANVVREEFYLAEGVYDFNLSQKPEALI
jgi:hypothetical protein